MQVTILFMRVLIKGCIRMQVEGTKRKMEKTIKLRKVERKDNLWRIKMRWRLKGRGMGMRRS